MSESFEKFERHSKAVFDASVERVDLRVRSRLNQARQAALAAKPPRFSLRPLIWAPAFGAVAAVVLGVAIWTGQSSVDVVQATAETHSGLEDLDVVASNEPADFLQDDIDFYDWADGTAAAGAGLAGVG